jgi:hypothetical protein
MEFQKVRYLRDLPPDVDEDGQPVGVESGAAA